MVQLLKKYFFVIPVVTLLILIVYASEHDPWVSENMGDLTANDLINDPAKARQNWNLLEGHQKEEFFKDQRVLKRFSDLFAAEKGINSLDLSAGSPSYDGISLKNGDSSFPVQHFNFKGAEVISLAGGGFKIKFSDSSDLSGIGFQGGSTGITFEGNNLILKEGTLSKGKVIVYNQNHLAISPNSIFTIEGAELATGDNRFDVYYGAASQQNNNFIQIDSNKIRIVGDDLTAKFSLGTSFEKLSVNGRITLVNGGITLAFDGEGNAYEGIQLGDASAYLEIIDERSGKKYNLIPENQFISAHLEGFGECGTPQITGSSILEITGQVSGDICKGPLIETGKYVYELFGGIYESKSSINEGQAQIVYQEFTAKYGREPNMNDIRDVKLLGDLINQRVTDMKIEQKFLVSQSISVSQAQAKIREWLNNANFPLSTLTPQEHNQLNQLYSQMASNGLIVGGVMEYQLGKDKGLIRYTPPNSVSNEVEVSPRIASAIIQNFYRVGVNRLDAESRSILQSYFIKQKLASR